MQDKFPYFKKIAIFGLFRDQNLKKQAIPQMSRKTVWNATKSYFKNFTRRLEIRNQTKETKPRNYENFVNVTINLWNL